MVLSQTPANTGVNVPTTPVSFRSGVLTTPVASTSKTAIDTPAPAGFKAYAVPNFTLKGGISDNVKTGLYNLQNGATLANAGNPYDMAKLGSLLDVIQKSSDSLKQTLKGDQPDLYAAGLLVNGVSPFLHGLQSMIASDGIVIPSYLPHSEIPNKGTYLEGLQNHPDRHHPEKGWKVPSEKEVLQASRRLVQAEMLISGGVAAFEGGTAGLAAYGTAATTMAGTAAASSGVGAAAGLQAGTVAMGIESAAAAIGMDLAMVGGIAATGGVVLGLALAGLAIYGLYKASGGEKNFEFMSKVEDVESLVKTNP